MIYLQELPSPFSHTTIFDNRNATLWLLGFIEGPYTLLGARLETQFGWLGYNYERYADDRAVGNGDLEFMLGFFTYS